MKFEFVEGKAEDSQSEAPTVSESDKESGITSILEDSSVSGVKESLMFKKISFHSSSFIQNILYEDSCTGVTVIDLFIALKSIKENLDLLSQSNEKISEHVNFLNEETETVWKEFIELLESMRIFLEKINADVSVYKLEKLEEKFSHAPETDSKSNPCKSNEKIRKSDNKNKCACEECGRDIKEIYANENKKFTCLGCLISAFKKKSLSQLPVSPEAFLGSFLASILYWQRGHERERKAKITKTSSLTIEKTASHGNLNIRESTVQMICDICEVLNVSTGREEEKSPLMQPFTQTGSGACGFNLKPPRDAEDEMGLSGGTPSESKQKRLPGKFKSDESSKDGAESRGDLTSEGDSEFEEALTCQSNHPHNLRTKPSVTCMGDLSKPPSSTHTSNNNITSSWVGKLSHEIKSKIKQRKLHKKTNVKVIEQPLEKSKIESKKTPEMLQFSIAANPSAGVFDVTVVQYKNHRYLAKYPMNCKKKVHPELLSNSKRDFQFPLMLKDSKDQFLSEESIAYSESESMETCSNFDDQDMEEFLGVSVKDKNNGNIQKPLPPLPVPGSKSHLHGDSRKMELKFGKTHFIEMHWLYTVFFMQEFVKKTRKTQQEEDSERVNLSNDASQEKIFSPNSGEKKEEQIVIEGSSSDLVIYIQLEIEDDSGSTPNCLLFDFEKSTLETQTKENDSGAGVSSRDKTIRLGDDLQKGESLFKVWRAQEENRISEMKATERDIVKKPLVVIKKEEENDKNEVNAMEMSMNFKENMREMFVEREIGDGSLEEVKVTDRANVLVIKDIKQSAPIWYHQVAKRWKSEIVRLRKLEVPKEIIESIKSSAGELRKALLLIREIESDIVDAQIDNAISILPRLELELRKHLHTKIKGLEMNESKNRMSLDNFFSSLDFGQRDDSIGGDSDESSEYRFNNLLKLLSNLENAVKTSEHSNNKIELSHYDSSKIYELLHALTVSIRELEGGLSVTSLLQTLNFASRLHTAVKEYDRIVKKQPADYLSPQERNRKKRKPRWKATEETSVSQHLKNVRKKVFEMVEMEAVGMEERIEGDFDRLDRLGTENDEALTFLETLLQKTQKRMSELQSLKTELKDMNSNINNIYENFQKAVIRETGEKMEDEVLEANLGITLVKSLDWNSENNQERISMRSSGKILKGTLHRVSEKNLETLSEITSDRIPEKMSEKSLEKKLVGNMENTFDENSEKIRKSVFEKNSERNSSTTPKRTSDRVPESTAESNLRKTLKKTLGKISDKTLDLRQNLDRSREKIIVRNSERNVDKIFEKSLETIPRRTPNRVSEEDRQKTGEKISKKSLERKGKRFVKTTSGGSLNRTSERLKRTSEEFLENTLNQFTEEIPEKNGEKYNHGSQDGLSERSRKAQKIILESTRQEEEEPKHAEGEQISQESLEKIISTLINAIDYLKSTKKKSEDKDVPASQSFEKFQAQELGNSLASDPLSSTIKEIKVIGQNSLYLSWTEPEGSLEGSINGYEIYVDGKLNQKVRNPQRLQAVLYSVDLSKKIQVQLYAVVDKNPKSLLATMDLNGE